MSLEEVPNDTKPDNGEPEDGGVQPPKEPDPIEVMEGEGAPPPPEHGDSTAKAA